MATMSKETKANVIAMFAKAETYEELKQAYIDALKDNKGAANAKFIDAEFDKVVANVKNVHKAMDGKKYTKDVAESTEDFKALIAGLLKIKGITIEQCGTWLWIGGDTKKHKDELKKAGFNFSGKKKMWFKKPEGTGFRKSRGWSMEKIRDTYGSMKIEDADEVAE